MDQLWLNLNFALASSLILCSFLSLCLFFKLCYTFKNTKMIGSAFEYEETGVSKKPKLYFKQYKVNLILQCYWILTINRICYLNLFPPLFWILGAKTNKQTNKHLVTTVLFCGQLSQNTWYTMVWFTNVAKAFHCLSIKREISSSCQPYLFLHHVWLCCPGMWMPPLSRVPCQLLLIVGGLAVAWKYW